MLGLWLTIGAANAAQVGLISRLLVGHARAPQVVRLERNSSETLRTVMGSVDQVVSGVVSSSVSLVSNGAVAVAVALGLVLSNPLVAVAVTVYFALIGVLWVRVVRGGLVRRGRQVQELYAQRLPARPAGHLRPRRSCSSAAARSSTRRARSRRRA